MCRNAKNHCKIIEPFITSLCSNQTLFPTTCENRYRDLKFINPSPAKCLSPILVPSEDSNIWFPGIDGCAYNCSDPRYSERDKEQLDSHILYASLVGLVLTASSCLTIHVSRPILTETAAIFYQCLCMLMVNCGFFFIKKFSQKEDIVCRPDSSLRYSEPGSSNENRWLCICTFLFTYYFTIAAFVWRVNLSLALSQKYGMSKGKPIRSRKTKATYQHLSAWSIPIMLIIIITCINEIDASFLIGVCFVGFNSLTTRLFFVLVPNAISALVSCFFLSLCLQPLFQARKAVCASKDANAIRQDSAKKSKINSFIAQIILIILFEISFLLIVIYANIYELINSMAWNEELKSSVICSLNVTDLSIPGVGAIESRYQCRGSVGHSFLWTTNDPPFSEKPASLKHVYLQLACVLLWSIVTSSWTWRRDSLQSWRRYLLQLLQAPNVEDPKFIRMHQIVAEAYVKYKNNNETDAVSPGVKYNDPLGLNLTSVASNDMSTTFVEELSNLLNSRQPIAKGSRSARKGRAISSRLNKRSLRSFFSSDKNGDGSSISDVSVFRSNVANSSVAESMGMGSMGNSRVSQEDIREMQETIKIQRKKTRRQYKEMSSRPHRRATETTSQDQTNRISAQATNSPANQQQQQHTESHGQQVTPHALSPELLVQLQYQALLQQAIAQQQQYRVPQTMNPGLAFTPLNQMASHQPTLQPRPYYPTGNNLRCMQTRIRPKVRPNSTVAVTDFSHGMTEQVDGMQNPLTEGRRPDSRVPYHDPNFQMIVPQSINPLIMNHSPYRHPLLSNAMANMMGHQFHNFLTPSQGLTNGRMPGPPFNPLPAVPGPKTEAELQSLMRERAECIALVAPVDSGSEFGDGVLPIAMSDSDAFCTDGETSAVASKSSNNSNLMIQQVVTQRMEKIEAEAAKLETEDESNDSKSLTAQSRQIRA